jgi:hypothetical protein
MTPQKKGDKASFRIRGYAGWNRRGAGDLLRKDLREMGDMRHSMSVRVRIMLAAAVLAGCWLAASPVPAAATSAEPEKSCQSCHDDELYRVRFDGSVHGNNSCTSCHAEIRSLPAHMTGKEKPAPVNCGSCHQEIARDFRKNYHYLQEEFRCTDCHRFHGKGPKTYDLTGYGSAEWTAGIIKNPAEKRFYGILNDRMPAYAAAHDPAQNTLSSEQIIMLTKWLRGEWDEEAPEQ